jgi:hypothetical protein
VIRAAAFIATLFANLAAAQVHAQFPSKVPPAAALSEQPAGTNTVLVIRAADLGSQTVVLEINGSKVAELTSNQSYTGVYSPGRLRFTFGSDAGSLPIDAYAIANEEHVYELQLVAAKGSGALAVLASGGATRPALMLKERKTLIAGYVPPPEKRSDLTARRFASTPRTLTRSKHWAPSAQKQEIQSNAARQPHFQPCSMKYTRTAPAITPASATAIFIHGALAFAKSRFSLSIVSVCFSVARV